MQRLNEREHSNIVHLIGTMTTNEDDIYLMYEYCELGILERYLQEKYQNNKFYDQINRQNSNLIHPITRLYNDK
jgi:serine/threonine protein kinase